MSANPVMVLQGASAIMKMQVAQTQAKGLAAQASYAKMQARSEMLKYKQQGVAVLENILRTKAAINARKSAGNIDPFSGSGAAMMQYAMATGTREYAMAENNALIALRGGEMQAGMYMTQATATMRAGLLQGLGAFGQAYATKSLIGNQPILGT